MVLVLSPMSNWGDRYANLPGEMSKLDLLDRRKEDNEYNVLIGNVSCFAHLRSLDKDIYDK